MKVHEGSRRSWKRNNEKSSALLFIPSTLILTMTMTLSCYHMKFYIWKVLIFLFYFRIKGSEKNMIKKFFVALQKVSNMSGNVGLRKLNGTKIFRTFFSYLICLTLCDFGTKKMWKLKKLLIFTWAFGTSRHQSSQPENYSTFVFLNDLKCTKRKRNEKKVWNQNDFISCVVILTTFFNFRLKKKFRVVEKCWKCDLM